MKPGFTFILFIIILLISGCTQTGRVTEPEGQNLTPEEGIAIEGFLNETDNITSAGENISPPSVYKGYTEPQNITQPQGCPETCDDGDNCTYDYCSKDTEYKCVYAVRICPNFVKICPDGVEVVCENTCMNDSCTRCGPDCTEHQLPACMITQDDCGVCQVLDINNCRCAQIVSCVNNDGCCPEGCDFTNDNDCEEPEGSCSNDTDCGDGNNCTTDRCQGVPKNCSHEEITNCISGDGCCPAGCNYANDTDCTEQFGNDEDIIINEIMYNPSTGQCDDSDCEWIELYDKGDYKVNLSGWTLDGKPFDAEIIQAKEYIIIARELIDGSDADTKSFEYFWGDKSTVWGDSETENYSAFDGSIGLNNMGGDTVILQSPSSYYDSITYSDDWGANGNNKTLERYGNNTWGESLTDGGTPGSKNSIS